MINYNGFKKVGDELPDPDKLCWLITSDGIQLGCRHVEQENWCWAECNGVMYEKNGEIVGECEMEDLDVKFWKYVTKPPEMAKYNVGDDVFFKMADKLKLDEITSVQHNGSKFIYKTQSGLHITDAQIINTQEKYLEKLTPKLPVHPGETIAARIKYGGWGIPSLCDYLGIRIDTLFAICVGHKKLTPELAKKFEKIGLSAEFLMNLQKECDKSQDS